MADTSPIKNNLLTFAGSEAFRNALISKNLKPYETAGSYSYDVKNQNYPIVFGEKVPVDTPDVSLNLFEKV